jgi:hypothetical protein
VRAGRIARRVSPWVAGVAAVVALADVKSGAISRGVSNAAVFAGAPADPIAELRAFEAARRAKTDFAALPTGDQVTGADPADLVALPGRNAFAAVLRGRDAVVVLDGQGHERQRLTAPTAPVALAVTPAPERHVYVAGSATSGVARYRIRNDGTLARDGELAVGSAASITDLAAGPEGVVYATEDYGGRLLSFTPGAPAAREFGRCHGPLKVVREDAYLLVDCMLDHEVRVYGVGADGQPGDAPLATLALDGPVWSVAAERSGERLVVALGGVEDRPLHRGAHGFGYIDSFVYVYALDLTAGLRVESRRAVNVSELGVVTPKWIGVHAWLDGSVAVETAGFGSDARASLHWTAHDEAPEVDVRKLPPGTVAMVAREGGFLAANQLMDAWALGDAAGVQLVPVVDDAPARTAEQKAGELLFFTTLMAPFNASEGESSRFTCETCHYEGYGDGRVHFTGRDDVHATARSLRGLQSNRPHFSRALDRTMADMVHNEFRVAGKGSGGRSAWFTLDAAAVPWLSDVRGLPDTLSPLFLRKALMTFLMDFTHRPNPGAVARAARVFTFDEARGAEVFRDRCEGCHQARLVADDPSSRVAFGEWPRYVLAPEGALVWGTERYVRTGVVPYVHEGGARVPALRRVYKRYPLFTNGAAPDLRSVVESARFAGSGEAALFMHAGVGDGAAAGLRALDGSDEAPLLAFLALL